MDINKIGYRLCFSDGGEKRFELHLRGDTQTPVGWVPQQPPDWAALEYHKCSNCPLPAAGHAWCPAALNLARLVDGHNDLDLLDSIRLVVTTADRTVTVSATVQKALGSFIGLLLASSDCPHAAHFRPLARFHLPLATEAETIYRVVTAFAMAQFMRRQAGLDGAVDLDGLVRLYGDLETVNTALAARLKAAGQDGSVARSLMEWDVFAGMFPMRAAEVMESMRPLFSAYLSDT